MVEECDVCDIPALVEMCKFSSRTKVWPETIHICPSGVTELAHSDVHPSFDQRLATHALAERMHKPHSGDRFFVLGLTKLTRESDVHGLFAHTMDGGKCIIESFGSMPKVHHHCLIAFVCVLVWLEGMSLRTAPEEKVANAFVLCMCMQGKHRSMYFARVLFAALELVLKSLKIKSELQFHWAACERVMASVNNNDSGYSKQRGPVIYEILPCWLHYYRETQKQASLFVLDFDERDYDRAMGDNNEGFNIIQYMKQVAISPVRNAYEMCEKNERSYYRLCDSLGSQHFVKSWQYFVGTLLRQNFPDQCSLCLKGQWGWRIELERFFSGVIRHNQAASAPAGVTAKAAAPKRIGSWADAQEEEESDQGMSLRTAQGSGQPRPAGDGGMSLRTAHASPEARPPVVMPPSILRTGGAARAAQPQKKVRLGEQEVHAMDSSDEYWQLKISLEKKIVASWNLVELDGREAQRQALLLQKVGKNGPHYLVTDSGSGHVALLDTAESLFEKHRELLGEVRFLWALVETMGIPLREEHCACRLQEVEVLLFLHMLSILVDSDALRFTVSATFLYVVGIYFRSQVGIDIMELIARFVYMIWLSPRMCQQTWNSFPGVLFPQNVLCVVTWWNEMQRHVRMQCEQPFCEEYLCLKTVPEGMLLRTALSAPMSFEDELKSIRSGFEVNSIRVVPDLPDTFFWQYHDAAVMSEHALAYPRILQPFRASGSVVEAVWGHNDGNPLKVSRENLVSQCHCFLDVKATCVRADMTLSELLGPLEGMLFAAFHAAGLPPPWWMPWSWYPRQQYQRVPPLQGNSSLFYTSLQYQILGSLVMSSIRPDNVFHPHLRSHVEFHLGRLLACEIVGERLRKTTVLEFMRGGGILFQAGEAWIDGYVKERKVSGKLNCLYAHTQWGEKCRIFRYVNDTVSDDSLWFVAVACPNQDKASDACNSHGCVVGCGILCNLYHGVNVKHAQQLMWNALHFLECAATRNRGRFQPGESLGYVDELLGRMGFKCPENVQYHINPERRLQLFHLPRAFPRFWSDTKIGMVTNTVFVGWGQDREGKHFDEVEVETLKLASNIQRKMGNDIEEFLLKLRKYMHMRPDDE